MGLEPQFIATKSLLYLVNYCTLDVVQQKDKVNARSAQIDFHDTNR